MNGITQGSDGNGKRNQEAGKMVAQKFNEGDTVKVKQSYRRKYWIGKIGVIDHCTLVDQEWRYIIDFNGETCDFDEHYLTKRGVEQDIIAKTRYAIWNSYSD